PGDQAGAGAGDHVPAVARPADLPPVDGGAPALVDHDEPGLRPAGELAFAVAADGLVPHHHRAGQDGRGEQREAHGPTTPPSARTLVPITSASPTTTPVNAVGAKNSSATSATCSTVTDSSRPGCSRSHSMPSPSAASADRVDARPPWLSSEMSSDPTA